MCVSGKCLGGMIVPLVSPLTMGVKAVTQDCSTLAGDYWGCPVCNLWVLLRRLPGGGQQELMPGACHLETAFQVILMHIPTRNPATCSYPFSVQMKTEAHVSRLRGDIDAGGTRCHLGNPTILLPWPTGAGVTSFLLLQRLSFRQLCIRLVRTHTPVCPPLSHSEELSICHLALCTVFWKTAPPSQPPPPQL